MVPLLMCPRLDKLRSFCQGPNDALVDLKDGLPGYLDRDNIENFRGVRIKNDRDDNEKFRGERIKSRSRDQPSSSSSPFAFSSSSGVSVAAAKAAAAGIPGPIDVSGGGEEPGPSRKGGLL